VAELPKSEHHISGGGITLCNPIENKKVGHLYRALARVSFVTANPIDIPAESHTPPMKNKREEKEKRTPKGSQSHSHWLPPVSERKILSVEAHLWSSCTSPNRSMS